MMADLIQEHRQFIEKLVKSNSKFSGNEDLFDDFCSETYQRSLMILQNVSDISNVQGYLKKIANTSILTVLKNEGRMIKNPNRYSTVTKKEVISEVTEVPDTISPEIIENNLTFETSETSMVEEPLAVEENPETETISFENNDIVVTEVSDVNFENVTENTTIETTDLTFENNAEVIENTEQQENIEEFTKFDNTEIKPENTIPEQEEVSYLTFDSFDEKPQLVFDIPDPVPTVEEIVVSREILNKIYLLVRNLEAKNPNRHFLDIFNLRYFKEMKQEQIADELGISQGEVSKRLLELSLMIRQEFR